MPHADPLNMSPSAPSERVHVHRGVRRTQSAPSRRDQGCAPEASPDFEATAEARWREDVQSLAGPAEPTEVLMIPPPPIVQHGLGWPPGGPFAADPPYHVFDAFRDWRDTRFADGEPDEAPNYYVYTPQQ